MSESNPVLQQPFSDLRGIDDGIESGLRYDDEKEA
jgi:hypothetical protein